MSFRFYRGILKDSGEEKGGRDERKRGTSRRGARERVTILILKARQCVLTGGVNRG